MNPVLLDANLGIEAAEELKTHLSHRFADSDPVQLDAGQVARVHSASVQVLYAFVRDRASRGKATRIDPVAPELQTAVRTLGLQQALGIEDNNA